MSKDNKDDEKNINSQYANIATMKKQEFIEKYKIDNGGLTNEEAERRKNKYGLNVIKKAKPKRWYNYFFESLFSAFNSILIGIALVLCYTDVYLADSPSYANIMVILVLVLVSTFLDFFEEYRSNKAAEKLKEMVATKTTVIRSGKEISIPI